MIKHAYAKKTLAPIAAIQLATIACLDAQTVLDFVNSTYTPDPAANTLVHRWAGIGTEGGTVFDLVVSYDSGTYPAAQGGIQGSGTGYGRLAVPDTTDATFNFAFVDPLNSDAPVTIANLPFSLLDVDQNSDTQFERVKFNLTDITGTGSPSMSLDFVGSNLTNLGAGEGFDYRFESAVVANAGNNPDNPLLLTADQESVSLRFGMTDVSSFKMRFQNDGHPSGRNMFFSGASQLIPEPSSTALLGLGLGSLLLRRRRA